MKRKLHFAGIFSIFAVAIAAAAFPDHRVDLLPKLQPGQLITYLIHFASVKKVQTESNVAVPFAPDATQIDAHGLLRVEILDVQSVNRKPVVRAKAKFLSLELGVPAGKPGEENPRAGKQNSVPAGGSIEFTISPDGYFEKISGLDALSPEQQQAWQEWAALFAPAWTLPTPVAKVGDKWKSEQPEQTSSLIADLAWNRDSSYVRNETCRPSVLSPSGDFSPSTGPLDTCAVLLTTAKLTQKSSPKDATPEDFKLHDLKTAGTAKGSNEIVTYISLTTGLVVRATEEASQQMDVVVAKSDGSNGVHYKVDAASRSEILLVTGTPLASH